MEDVLRGLILGPAMAMTDWKVSPTKSDIQIMGVKCIVKWVIRELFQGCQTEGSKLAGFIVDPKMLVVVMMNRRTPLRFFWLYKMTNKPATGIGRTCTGMEGILNEMRSWKGRSRSRTPQRRVCPCLI